MHPLTKDGRTFGVVEFASKNCIEPTPASRDAVRTLAQVISRSYQMNDIRKAQRENTKNAMQLLEDALATQDWKRLALPQMFVPYPGIERLKMKAKDEHTAIIKIIKDVTNEFKHILSVIDWEDVTEPGNITSKVIRDIGSSDFGICYLSEPTQQGQFCDNANVLFEAGMMQALTNSANAIFRAWIPIREKESGAIPFDIATERILFVDRSGGKLDEARFADAIRNRIWGLIKNESAWDDRDDKQMITTPPGRKLAPRKVSERKPQGKVRLS